MMRIPFCRRGGAGFAGCTLVALGLVAMPADALQAQVGEENLDEPEAIFPEALSLVRGVRELPDGRLMVADPLSQVLLIADLDAGRADTLGGVGQGPSEYRQPDGLFALPGDSTLLVDLGNARLTVIGPAGEFGETMPITQGEPGRGGRFLIVMPSGVDGRGGLYFRRFGGSPGAALPDSAPVLRYDRGDGAIDTVANVKLPTLVRSSSGGASNRSVNIRQRPMSPEDGWGVGSDGRIAVARADGYRLEWMHPDGRVVRGPTNPFTPVKIGRSEKEEWVERLQVGGLRMSLTVENGERRMSFSRGGGGVDVPDIDSYDWPETKPAFEPNGVWVTPEGVVWLQRHVAAGERPLVDVFGADARLKARVRLPAGRRIVGFGAGTVYLIRTDDLGLQYLERYRRAT